MKRMNRLLSLLLCLVMVLSLLPVQAHAAYEDGDECWNCGHYHWDEYMHECGACSPSCTNDWCALETHCHRCGGCLNGDYPCDECGLCKDCMDEIGHCSQCDMCWMDNGGNDVLCGNCGRCEFCSVICPECGMCEDCANDWSDGMHCPRCGNCYQVTGQCEFIDNNHCKECCEPCEQCGECVAGDHLDTCSDCGLCTECCEFNSMMAGCEDGSICVSDFNAWDERTCENCMTLFQDPGDLCETCADAGVHRCPECCELASQCSEKMCEYDDEYEDHFCIDCGSCFHDVTLCDTCAGAGEYRCEDCCENLTNSLGCDGSCGDVWCSNDPYFEQHLEEEHEDRPDFDDHDAFPSNRWSHNKTSHWRECRLCDEDENEELWESHRVGLAAHSYDSNGVCTVCGYSVGNKLYISRQPRTAHCTTSIAIDYDEDPANGLLWFDHHPVTFSVAVKGGTGSYTYQWYRIYKNKAPTKLEDGMLSGQFSGTHTATLTVLVSPEACGENGDYQYYCVITDGKTTVSTEKVTIKASHAYSNKEAINTESTNPKKATYKAVSLTYINSKGETVTVTAPASEGHRHQCLSDSGTLSRHYKTKNPVMHTFGDPVLLGKSTKSGATDYDKVYEKTCTACGYTTYYETHQHIYHAEESDPEKYNRGTFQVDEEKTTNMAHAMVCLVDGCDHIKMESHEWDWRHMGYGSDAEGGGIFYRECRICGYPDYDYRPVDKDGNKINWTTKNVLVTAINAQVSRTLAVEGDRLTLTINHNSYTQGKRCTGWKVEYTTPDGTRHDITSAYTIGQNDTGTWDTVIKLSGHPTGGILLFTPTMADCTSHEYVTEGYVAPVCMYDGFAGYRVCRYCHTPDPTDTRSDEERIIPAAGSDHTGTKQPLYQKEVTLPSGKKTITWTTNKSESNGKRYNYKEGSCTEKGCEGDFLCSDCQHVIPGKWDYKHPPMHLVTRNQAPFSCFKNGYSGDDYCELCGKLVNKGYVIEAPREHQTLLDVDGSAIAATCTVPGKEADQWCLVCGEVFSGKATPALGHSWVVDTAHCTETTTAYQCDRAGCTATKFADVVTDSHAVKVDGGTALVGGKAVKKAAQGETVTLKLGAVPEGKRFKEWEVVSGGVVLTNATDPNGASFTMGALDVEINAVLEDIPTYDIVVVNGKATDGAGSEISRAAEGTVITITADPAETGKQFDRWEVIYGGVAIADANSAATTFSMGSENVKVRATYKDAAPSHTHTYGEDWKSDAEHHWHACTDTACPNPADSVKDKAAHTASDWIIDTAATATTDGTKHKECTVCHKVLETATIPATGSSHTHAYGETWKSDADNHWHECSCGDKADLAAHTFVWKIDKEATKTETGLKHEECSACGAKRSENTVIDKLPDDGSTDPGDNTKPGGDQEKPRTGDASGFMGWTAALFVSGGILAVLGAAAQKRKESEAD